MTDSILDGCVCISCKYQDRCPEDELYNPISCPFGFVEKWVLPLRSAGRPKKDKP